MSSTETDVHEALAAIASGRASASAGAAPEASGPALLGERTSALARLAASIALDAPP